MNFQNNLTFIRKKRGLSQEDLAFKIGVSRQTIYSWEAGINAPSIVMLKKLSDAFEVTTDDLLSGYQVNKLPIKIGNFTLSKIGEHKETVIYKELPNWFISLKEDDEVCWGLYVNGKIDEAHHLKVVGKATIHDENGVEIKDEAYDGDLNLNNIRTFYCKEKEDGIGWFAVSEYLDNVKTLLTYKDKKFLKKWGINGKYQYQKFSYDTAEDYILECNNKKISVIKISYFASSNADSRQYFIEVFLNKNLESLLWRRYSKTSTKSNETMIINDFRYDLDYECITDRLSKLIL